MKKISSIFLVLLVSLFLFACQPNESDNNQTLEPPIIVGAADIIYYLGENTPDYLAGVFAYDALDTDITEQIEINDTSVDLTQEGTYQLFYKITDQFNQTYQTYVYVIVMPELVEETIDYAPVIYGTKDITYNIGKQAPNYLTNVGAADYQEGIITDRITIDDSEVDLTTPGVYPVIYRVIDEQLNETVVTIFVTVQVETIDHLNIYYINDTHGALLPFDNQLGLANIANLILSEKEAKPNNTLFISGGDLLQGNIISNYFYGSSMIDALNMMQHEAFVLGNHEFDWGLEVATQYFNPETEGVKANFPLLGANVFLKGTKTLPDFVEPYTIIEKGHLKVGVIGLMGFGLESSIATARVSAYEFGDPIDEARYYTEYLRTEKDVDVVLVVIHGSDEGFNQAAGQLSGNQRIDAVFNGHSHQAYTRFVGRSGVDMPVIQAGANGTSVGWVHLHIGNNKDVVAYEALNLGKSNDARLGAPHPGVAELLDMYVEEIEPLLNDPIIYAGTFLSRGDLTLYMAKLMRMATGSDIAFHNSGGTRASIDQGQAITVATLYQVFPFDNRIKTVTLKGEDFIDYMNRYGNYSLREGITEIDPDQEYKVATNDYLFDQVDGPFIGGTDIDDTGIYIRDLFETVLRNLAETSDTFTLDAPIVIAYKSKHEELMIQQNA
ncbi:MAG: 5'-nucleotidase C-terminal domain-containing protein [Acholeplasmataceae bacterium]